MISREGQNDVKKKTIRKDKYFNCYKMRHFKRDCIVLDTRPLKKKAGKAISQQRYQKKNPVYIVAVVDNNSNTKPKPFRLSKTYMAKEKFNL